MNRDLADTVRDPDYFLQKARQCFRLADSCSDRALSFKLRQLGLEFIGNAVELGADANNALPLDWDGSARSPS